jgi:hypothetical protein
MIMEDFEKLGIFYLGREYDSEAGRRKDNLLLYESKDLLTHAVCVGMTGSGKTGLCIALLEEAALDRIPSIVIDPKGDLANLLLTFPGLSASEFLPWVNEEDAQKQGLSREVYAESQARLWEKGLAEWGQDRGRIGRLRSAADFAIYTPGSSAGLPVSILKSFASPAPVILNDSDLLRERITVTVTGMLNLLGIEADPLQSREHILIATILEGAWKSGRPLDLPGLIMAIQSPPVQKIGIFDLESFFPAKERFALAMRLNNLLAAPGFQSWLQGEPLDMDRMLYTAEAKPRVSIFSIAHLSDAERMFFVSLLLTELVGWMRSQPGTTSLRALLYMDEIYGYFPPVANPPSKEPLITLLKQARAFGLGCLLATQNPVDLDYRGLANIGTWFIGRLQTERDKARMIEGLEGAAGSTGGRFDRQQLEQTISRLGKRVFLMNNVHEDAPLTFETRWVMSYLGGPLTRDQIKLLMDEKRSSIPPAAQPAPAPPQQTAAKEAAAAATSQRPLTPPGVPEYFVPVQEGKKDGGRLLYEPMLLCIGTIYYADAAAGAAAREQIGLLADIPETSALADWEKAERVALSDSSLEKFPDDSDASYRDLPKNASAKGNYPLWGKSFHEWLYRNMSVTLMKSPSLGEVSRPGESERDFRIRLQTAAREKRDVLIDRLSRKYTEKIAALEERIRRAEQAVDREKEQAQQQKLQTALSLGTTIFDAMLSRRKGSRSTLGRASTTAGRAGRILKETKDVERAEENVDELRKGLAALHALLAEETEAAQKSADPLTETLEQLAIKPKKKDISVALAALVWVPYQETDKGGIVPVW